MPVYLPAKQFVGIGQTYPRGVRNDFLPLFVKGDFLAGGSHFGLGSRCEHAPAGIKSAGLVMVLVKSFARIFFAIPPEL